MDNNSDYKSIIDSKRQSKFEQDSEDILRQISQITPSQDKSFDSPVVFTRNHAIFHDYNIDINQLVRDNNISLFNSQDDQTTKDLKKENISEDSSNILINTKQLTLNQKLKYLCSLIEISNINIKKYDDLKKFNNKYLEDKNIMLNIFEPVSILFDVINELIFVIQKELRNNDILMKELKRLRYNRSDNEKQIYKLKMTIKNKEKELNELRILKKDDYIKYNENEINELKIENKELYKKINTYKFQIKKFELQNNENKIRLKSFNTAHDTINNNRQPSNIIINNFGKTKVTPNLYTIDNINDNKIINNLNSISSLKKSKLNKSENKILNISDNKSYSTSKDINCKNFNQNIILMNNNSYINSNNNNNIYIETNNYNNNYNNGRSIVANLMFLLKEINKMLNIYNSSLSKMKINHNYNTIDNSNKKKNNGHEVFEENNNKKIISSDFVNKINDIIINIKNYMKEENKNRLNKNNIRKPIYVNTSKWKFRKKKKNDLLSNDKNDKEEEDSSFQINNKTGDANKINLKLIDKYNYINNEETSVNK